jgi:NADPH-dependent curcumin reductase CurA
VWISHVGIGVWVAQGRLKLQQTVVDGRENAPTALVQLCEGANRGQMLVKVADPAS